MTFEQFFQAATGHAPYDYQRRLTKKTPLVLMIFEPQQKEPNPQ